MGNSEGTTIWIDKITAEQLRHLATLNERSVGAQVRYMVKAEMAKLGVDGPNEAPQVQHNEIG